MEVTPFVYTKSSGSYLLVWGLVINVVEVVGGPPMGDGISMYVLLLSVCKAPSCCVFRFAGVISLTYSCLRVVLMVCFTRLVSNMLSVFELIRHEVYDEAAFLLPFVCFVSVCGIVKNCWA